MYLFAYAGAESIEEILKIKEYWLSNGVVDGLLMIAFLMAYRVDAQSIALNENDLEDTEWLTSKKLRKMHEFHVTSWHNSDKADD
jgi:hypothetical protein